MDTATSSVSPSRLRQKSLTQLAKQLYFNPNIPQIMWKFKPGATFEPDESSPFPLKLNHKKLTEQPYSDPQTAPNLMEMSQFVVSKYHLQNTLSAQALTMESSNLNPSKP
ncbi:hypothetical protein Scep_017477 [Stephania cephalantha]|uniref:Uncharacterized protein n=1 Tax=Stephania cephalantha TaxID=152367 RepID=A0AAP0IPH9_9MAGN